MTHHRGNTNVVWVWVCLLLGNAHIWGFEASFAILLHHDCSWIRSDWRILLSVSDLILP